MTTIESGDLVDRRVSSECRLFIEYTLKTNKYDLDLHELIDGNIPNRIELHTTDTDRVVVRDGDRLWFKMPYIILENLRDEVMEELVSTKNIPLEDATEIATNITESYVYSKMDYTNAELGLDITLNNKSSNSTIRKRKSKYISEGGELFDIFDDFNIIEGDRIELRGFTGTVGAEELDREVEKLKMIFGSDSEILFCQPT